MPRDKNIDYSKMSNPTRCDKCQQTYNESDFLDIVTGKQYVMCSACRKVNLGYYYRDKEARIEQHKEWNKKNKERNNLYDEARRKGLDWEQVKKEN